MTFANMAETIARATVQIERVSGPSTTTYTLTGEPGAVRGAVRRLEREFPSDGYGTVVKFTEAGAVVTRANSCD